MTTNLVFDILILDLNKNKQQMGWIGRNSIRSYFNFIHKISITMQVLRVLMQFSILLHKISVYLI